MIFIQLLTGLTLAYFGSSYLSIMGVEKLGAHFLVGIIAGLVGSLFVRSLSNFLNKE